MNDRGRQIQATLRRIQNTSQQIQEYVNFMTFNTKLKDHDMVYLNNLVDAIRENIKMLEGYKNDEGDITHE